MKRLFEYIRLPREVSAFEVTYLQRINRVALIFFWLHLPVFALISLVVNGRVLGTLALTLGVLVGPTLAFAAFSNRPRVVGHVFAVTAMLMGGVLVYIDRGPMQIEMHFYFFVLIALLAVFANPSVVVTAALTVAGHHLVLFLVIPETVFNYSASWWAVAVHVVFVVLESVAACFVARSFFDNVIGLERIVQQRTSALDARNGDMALILNNVAQGFATIRFDGAIGSERSPSIDRWFGAPAADVKWWDFAGKDEDEAAWIRLGMEGLIEGFMPVEATLDQLPKRGTRVGVELAFEYRPIGEPATALLVVVTDITADVARRRVEQKQRELLGVLEKSGRDRAGFTAFLREAKELVEQCVLPSTDLASMRRFLHTLKGNAGLFGAESITEVAHALETELEVQGEALSPAQRDRLRAMWAAFEAHIEPLGITNQRTVVVARDEFDAAIHDIQDPAPAWTMRIRDWGKDSTRPHLERLAEQAVTLADRLGKPGLTVVIDDQEVRVDREQVQPVFAALVHAVRNAVSHGIESPEAREEQGKASGARLTLRTKYDGTALLIDVIDDGAGINWDRVAKRAVERGLPTADRRDLQNALFSGKVSTADEITELSGRGVGLDALRTACRELGGDVVIESASGRGTAVRCRIELGEPVLAAARAIA